MTIEEFFKKFRPIAIELVETDKKDNFELHALMVCVSAIMSCHESEDITYEEKMDLLKQLAFVNGIVMVRMENEIEAKRSRKNVSLN